MKENIVRLCAICMVLFLFSCKKEKDNIAATTQLKIVGKWNIDSVIINKQLTGNTSYDVQKGEPGDYIEFKPEGQMITYFNNDRSVSSFKVRNDTQLTIDGDTGYIKDLTANNFKLYTKASAGSFGFVEVTYFLSK